MLIAGCDLNCADMDRYFKYVVYISIFRYEVDAPFFVFFQVECLMEADGEIEAKLPSQTLRQYLFSLCPSAITGRAVLSNTIHLFSDVYEQARHDACVSSV